MITYIEKEQKYLSDIKIENQTTNWINGCFHAWGEVKAPSGISCSVSRKMTEKGRIYEEYSFINTADETVRIKTGDLGIWTPFNDSYDSADITERENCHAHLWCGGKSSYVCCLSMGGKSPHLGLVLTAGSIDQYLAEREESSNDRGDIMLLVAPTEIKPNEKYTVSWEIFEHQYDDFFDILAEYQNYVPIESRTFTFFKNENARISVNGDELDLPKSIGYHKVKEETHTFAYQILPVFKKLIRKRCEFIVNNQQEHEGDLKGAYMIYDNETQSRFFEEIPVPDHNAGRERIGMGALIAKYLQIHFDKSIYASLMDYVAFILREHFDPSTGEVFNSIHRDNSWRRIYNNAWFATFFREVYKLTKDNKYLSYMCGAFFDLYNHGGERFYPLNIEMYDSINCLEKANMNEEKEKLFAYFKKNADYMLSNGTHYPSFEVKFEDNIVTPAGSVLLQMYKLTGDESYLSGAKEHLDIHKIFLFFQPDARMHGVSIHHWDDFWFGKRRLYGDTYPHYWSTTGSLLYAQMSLVETDKHLKQQYEDIARAGIRSCLGNFFPDGSATCAIVTPYSINGTRGEFIDPWANDQDWAMYHALLFDEMMGI